MIREMILIAGAVACLAFACARIDTDAMARCQTRHSFDTCHGALNR